jgi:ribonuclease-3
VTKVSVRSAEKFAELTGYRFKDDELLMDAITHSSHNSSGRKDYERLEFLGDRILGMVVAEQLYKRYPQADEGMMARQFTYLVRKGTCTLVAKDMGLSELMRAGRSMEGKQTRSSNRMLGDACEAVLAAIYFDSGFAAVRKFILRYWKPYLDKASAAPRDPKTRLQEWALAKGLALPQYKEISREGPDHEPMFIIEVSVPGYEPVRGQATSKRRGEQLAAETFIERQRIKHK